MNKRLAAILPSTLLPDALSGLDRLAILREQVLQALLLGASLACAVLLAAQARWGGLLPVGLGIATALLAGLVVVTVQRGWPYRVRAVTLLATMAGLTLVYQHGAPLSLFAALSIAGIIILAVSLLGAAAGLGAAGLWTLTIIFFLATRGRMPVFNTPGWPEPTLAVMLFVLTPIILWRTNRELLASSLKEKDLAETLRREREGIENRLNERNLYFQRRLIEARVAAEITRAISSILDPQVLLQRVVDLMQDRFKLYYIGVFVLDADRQFAVLRAGSGEAGKRMLADGHRLPVSETSMIGWTTLHKEPRIALDVGLEPVRFNNPHLPHTRSELALPIVARDQVLGALSVQSTQPNAFDEDDILILHGIADSLGIALENARLYQQTQDTLEEIQTLNRNYLQKAWAETVGAQGAGALGCTYDNLSAEPPAMEEANRLEFPLLLREQPIGQIVLESDRPALSAEDQAFIEAVLAQTAIALENTRLMQETQRRAFEEQKLNQMSEQFSQAVSIEEILKIAVRELSGLPSSTGAAIHLVPPQPGAAAPAAPGSNGNGRNGSEA